MKFRRKKIFHRRRRGFSLILSITIFSLLTTIGLVITEAGIRPIIMDIANLETQKIATSTINYALNQTIKEIDMNELIAYQTDEEGNVLSVGFDANVYNDVVVNSVASAQHYLKLMEQGKLDKIDPLKERYQDYNLRGEGIIYYIPLGAATKNAFLAHLGPEIPVKFTAIGDVDVDLNETVKNVGINNTWVNVSLDLEVQVEVIIPFATEMEKVRTTIPVGMVLVPGEVPFFYGGGEGGRENSPVPAVLMEK